MTQQADATTDRPAWAWNRSFTPGPAKGTGLPLVIGLGNLHLSDDGAGVHLARHLKAALPPGSAACMDGGLMSLSLFPHVEAATALVLLHCADHQRAPGSVAVFEGGAIDRYLRGPRARSIQERGLIDLLDLAEERGCLPGRRALVCIQPRRLEWGEALSLPVFHALPVATTLVAALLERWHGD